MARQEKFNIKFFSAQIGLLPPFQCVWYICIKQPVLGDKLPSSTFLLPGVVGEGAACNAGNSGMIPGLGRSLGAGNGNPLQYSCLENP